MNILSWFTLFRRAWWRRWLLFLFYVLCNYFGCKDFFNFFIIRWAWGARFLFLLLLYFYLNILMFIKFIIKSFLYYKGCCKIFLTAWFRWFRWFWAFWTSLQVLSCKLLLKLKLSGELLSFLSNFRWVRWW